MLARRGSWIGLSPPTEGKVLSPARHDQGVLLAPRAPGFAALGALPTGRAGCPSMFILPLGKQWDNIDCYLRRALGSQEVRGEVNRNGGVMED